MNSRNGFIHGFGNGSLAAQRVSFASILPSTDYLIADGLPLKKLIWGPWINPSRGTLGNIS